MEWQKPKVETVRTGHIINHIINNNNNKYSSQWWYYPNTRCIFSLERLLLLLSVIVVVLLPLSLSIHESIIIITTTTTTVAATIHMASPTFQQQQYQQRQTLVSFQQPPSFFLRQKITPSNHDRYLRSPLSLRKKSIRLQLLQRSPCCSTKRTLVTRTYPGTRVRSRSSSSSSNSSSSNTNQRILLRSDPMAIDPLVLEFLYNTNRHPNHLHTSTGTTSTTSTMIDPWSFTTTSSSSTSSTTLQHPIDTIFEISRGIDVWRRTLLKGQIPIPDMDFNKKITTANENQKNVDSTTDSMTWPSDPILYQAMVQQIMIPYQLPQLVQRHPEMIHPVLRLVLSLYMEYTTEMMTHPNEFLVTRQERDPIEDYDVYNEDDTAYVLLQVFDPSNNDSANTEPSAVMTQIIQNNQYYQQLQKSVTIVQSLDQLFDVSTTNHLMVNRDINIFNSNSNNNDPTNGDTATPNMNALWHHTGWKIVPALQRQIQQLPKLKQLIQSLGRRSTTISTQSDHKYHKFRVRSHDVNSVTTSAYMDPIQSPRDYVSGLTRSNRYQDMLPTEAILLLSTSASLNSSSSSNSTATSIDGNVPHHHHRRPSVLRSLFYSKIVESQLLSYEISGWTDAPTRLPNQKNNNKKKPPRYHRTPSARGGPILICLDTSYSMCDSYKESISKAIVLACVQAAHQQQRYCRVVAFGPKGTIMEAGDSVLRADTMGIQNLLNFLSNSLGGGTDVTGALKYAMTLLSSPNATPQVVEDDDEDVDKAVNCNNNNNDDGIYDMMAADLLLITDGEIPDPPVSDMVMGELMNLRQQSEVQIHGILVGHTKSNDVDNSSSKKAIKTLEKICTHVHDFLIDFHIPNKSYDNNVMHQRQRDQIISQKVSALRMTSDNSFHNPLYGSIPSNRGRVSGHRCRKRTRLFNRRKYYDDDDEEYDNFIRRDNSFDLDDDPFQSPSMKQDRTRTMNRMIRVDSDNEIDIPSMEPLNDYNSRVDHSVEKIKKVVHRQLKENKWKASDLDNEINNSKESLKSLQDQLRTAIQHVGDNLIERDIEARLVVLGMLAGEHVLLIGPPGTAKSALGRRLSKICGGLFFQRLLTRFTTPEEIFGPLSLRALENDEYRRCTDGFLPKASVAFLDEIFKANSAILNTLLTILNERQFDNGAGLREECPIRCVIAASNELPESDELEALYDRFLLRKEVLPISDDGVVQLLTTTSTTGVLTSESDNLESNKDSNIYSSTNPIDGLDRICESLLQAARRVQLETDISYLLRDLRIFLRDELNVNMSDRRLVKAAHLLKVSAATHGRTRVDPLDCLLLQHMAWNVPEQRDMIIEWLLNHITPGSMSEGGSKIVQCNILLNSLRQSAIVSIRRTSGDITGAAGANESDVAIISSIQLEVSQLVSLLQAESDALDRHIELLRRSMSYLWLDLDQARSLQQQLLPIAEQARDRNFRTLCHARALEILLTRDSGTETVVSNDIRLSAIEQLWDDDDVVRGIVVNFTEDELNMSMKEAKMKYADSDTFRRWKRERKKAGIK